jgi:hypothetical protein
MAFRKVAQFKEVSLAYVSPSGASAFTFKTDMPGGLIASRFTGVLPQTPLDHSVRTTTFSLVDVNGAPLEGTLYVPRVDPFATSANGGTQLRSGVIWLRPIGVYLDGTLDEFFETLPIAVGS